MDPPRPIDDDDLLPIIAVTSANYAPVFAWWRSSLDLLEYPAGKRHVVDLGRLQPPFGYCTASWCYAIEQQLTEVVNWVEGHQGEYVLSTDTDIQFFPRFLPVQQEWLRWMRRESLDMIFMRERTQLLPELREGEVNTGFCVIHCNERTLSFWRQVLSDELMHPKMEGCPPYTDQYHVNRALLYKRGASPQRGAFNVRWATIPDAHCIWSEPACLEEVASAAFHHAVNTSDKPALLQRVLAQVLAVQTMQPQPRHVKDVQWEKVD